MKKYNMPEMKISMFNVESISTNENSGTEVIDSATFYTHAGNNGATVKRVTWAQVEAETTISF